MVDLPIPVVRSETQLLDDFGGGQPEQLKLRNFVHTMFAQEGRINVIDFGADPTGAKANFSFVLDQALAAAAASTDYFVEIYIPPGVYKMGTTVTVRNNTSIYNKRLSIRGAGSQLVRILEPTGASNAFVVGTTTLPADRDTHITFAGFSLWIDGGTQTGAAFKLNNTTGITFDDIYMHGPRQGWSLGVGASQINDCIYTFLHNCAGLANANYPGVPMIDIGSGGVLVLDGGQLRWSGSELSPFISHSDAARNWDGLYVYDQFMEQFTYYISSTGIGIVNALWTGGQCDRFDIAFRIAGAANSNNMDWNIGPNIKFVGGTDGCRIDASAAGASAQTISLSGNNFNFLNGHIIRVVEGSGIASNNNCITCGRSGVSLFYYEAAGNFTTFGNRAEKGIPASHAGEGNYAYGIVYEGASTGRRSGDATNNEFLDAGSGTVTGTP